MSTTASQLPWDGVSATDASALTRSQARRVILASSLGTLFEWYDFFIYGSLAAFFGTLFFPKGSETAAFLASLATFGAGFAVRPLGGLLFGILGDTLGRKLSFLTTIVLMGASTAAIGFLPTFQTWGWAAPAALVGLRLLQGLALGGEYGGAAIYVAEHAPDHRRGTWTSWIQTTASLGLLASLLVVLICRLSLTAEQFAQWGWRIPFVLSLALPAVSFYVRMKLSESPVFQTMRDAGRLSKRPISETFRDRANVRRILVMLFGGQAGLAAVWYTCQFYALFFLLNTLKMPFVSAYTAIAVALVIGTPLFVLFGWLSDQIGRKWIILASFALTAVTLVPIFHALAQYGNPGLAEFQSKANIRVEAKDCNFNIFAAPATPCDKARDFLTKAGLSYAMLPASNGEDVTVRIAGSELRGFDAARYEQALVAAGYSASANPGLLNLPAIIALLSLMMVYVAMAYAPMAAYFVELFPARIRYTSMSVTYHVGVGWLGGFSPFISAALVVYTGNIFAGLWYPIALAVLSLAVGSLFIRETRNNDISV
jgi:MFS family permease